MRTGARTPGARTSVCAGNLAQFWPRMESPACVSVYHVPELLTYVTRYKIKETGICKLLVIHSS